MAWVWGGPICLANQWQECLGETCLKTVIFCSSFLCSSEITHLPFVCIYLKCYPMVSNAEKSKQMKTSLFTLKFYTTLDAFLEAALDGRLVWNEIEFFFQIIFSVVHSFWRDFSLYIPHLDRFLNNNICLQAKIWSYFPQVAWLIGETTGWNK